MVKRAHLVAKVALSCAILCASVDALADEVDLLNSGTPFVGPAFTSGEKSSYFAIAYLNKNATSTANYFIAVSTMNSLGVLGCSTANVGRPTIQSGGGSNISRPSTADSGWLFVSADSASAGTYRVYAHQWDSSATSTCGGWTTYGWTDLGAPAPDVVSSAPGSVYDPASGTTYVYVLGKATLSSTSGYVYVKTYTTSAGWSSWASLSNAVPGIPGGFNLAPDSAPMAAIGSSGGPQVVATSGTTSSYIGIWNGTSPNLLNFDDRLGNNMFPSSACSVAVLGASDVHWICQDASTGNYWDLTGSTSTNVSKPTSSNFGAPALVNQGGTGTLRLLAGLSTRSGFPLTTGHESVYLKTYTTASSWGTWGSSISLY